MRQAFHVHNGLMKGCVLAGKNQDLGLQPQDRRELVFVFEDRRT